MDEDAIFGIIMTISGLCLIGVLVSFMVFANNTESSSEVWKQAVQRGYAEEVQTSKGSAYVWKD